MEHLAESKRFGVSRGNREERSGVRGTRRGLNVSAVETRSPEFFFIHAEKNRVLSSRFCR
jgi:hypothetical protein